MVDAARIAHAEQLGAVARTSPSARTQILTRLAATEARVRAEAPGKRFLHLATHGVVAGGAGAAAGELFSGLVFTPAPAAGNAEDGMLRLFEIYDLALNGCDLAVLSACDSQVGARVSGEGVFALSRGVLAAGAARVVATQWAVQDDSTAELTGSFFEGIAGALRARRSPDYARALRDAKRRLRARAEWSAPCYWAPFELTGLRGRASVRKRVGSGRANFHTAHCASRPSATIVP